MHHKIVGIIEISLEILLLVKRSENKTDAYSNYRSNIDDSA